MGGSRELISMTHRGKGVQVFVEGLGALQDQRHRPREKIAQQLIRHPDIAVPERGTRRSSKAAQEEDRDTLHWGKQLTRLCC